MDIKSYQDVLDALQSLQDDGDEAGASVQKRRRIIAAAADLFARVGYRRTSISDIAKQAAIAKGTVYLYFPNKAAILLKVALHERLVLYQKMAPLLGAESDPTQRLRQLLRQAVLLADSMPVSNRIKAGQPDLIAALRELDLSTLRQAAAVFVAIFRWLIRSAAPTLPDDLLEDRVTALIAVLQGMPAIAQPRSFGGRSPEAFADALADVLLFGAVGAPSDQEET